MTSTDRVINWLNRFIDDMSEPHRYYHVLSSSASGMYKYASIYDDTNDKRVLTFRGRTYSDLADNIAYAWEAHNFMNEEAGNGVHG